MFITFEGVEGSGKSTQIRLLHRALASLGEAVVVTREPGGTKIGDQIRKILLDSANRGMVSRCEALLYWAARAQHVDELIAPALKSGRIVLCDRYVDSTIAYQGYARGIDFKILETLREMTVGELRPDKTFLFDLPVEEGLQRARRRISRRSEADKEDRFENEVVAFHERVRTGFLDMAKKEPERFVVLDASMPIEALRERVWGAVSAMLK